MSFGSQMCNSGMTESQIYQSNFNRTGARLMKDDMAQELHLVTNF